MVAPETQVLSPQYGPDTKESTERKTHPGPYCGHSLSPSFYDFLTVRSSGRQAVRSCPPGHALRAQAYAWMAWGQLLVFGLRGRESSLEPQEVV